MPQVILVDGNGVLHPRGFGIASHLGVLCGIPTIGCSKKPFQWDEINYSEAKRLLSTENNDKDHVLLVGSSGTVWGCALKSTPKTTNPIYVSIGHKISLETCIEVVKKCCKYRIPEPIRVADLSSRDIVKTF